MDKTQEKLNEIINDVYTMHPAILLIHRIEYLFMTAYSNEDEKNGLDDKVIKHIKFLQKLFETLINYK